MPRLQQALKCWIEEGHTQKEFAQATKIDPATSNRIFNGERGLTLKQRAAIYKAFKARADLSRALDWIVADLRDNIPPEIEKFITVRLEEPAVVRDRLPRSRKDRAKMEFIMLLEADDPAAIDLVLSLYSFSHGRRGEEE